MKNKFKEFLNQKGFYVALYSSAAIIVVIAGIISFNNINSIKTPEPNSTKNNQIDMEQQLEPANKSDVKSYKETTTETTTQEITTKETKPASKDIKTVPNNTENAKEKPQEKQQISPEANIDNTDKIFSLFDDSKEMSWPVSGKIVMDYSIETAVYDKTLDQYRTNDSICISAPVGTQVKAAAEGIVKSVFKDDESGQTVVIDHGNGWTSTYSQLQDRLLVKEGQVVKEGDVIGGVGDPSKYSILLGSHLDFKLSKDDKSTDPKLVLAEYEE